MTSSDILAISSPGILFRSDSLAGLKQEYRSLIKQWHPDINSSPDANNVLIKIKELYEKAQTLLSFGHYETDNTLRLTAVNGVMHKFLFLKKHFHELGTMFVGSDFVLHVIDKRHKELYDNAKKALKFKFHTGGKMEEEVTKYLPQMKEELETATSYIVVYKKTEDLLLLRDVLPHLLKIKDLDRHVAWIISTMHNLLCYFQFAEFAHLSISLDTYFISPKKHSGALLGGWWYATLFNEKIKFLPTSTYSLFYADFWKSKKAGKKTDQYLIRRIGRALLGSDDGIILLKNKMAPVEMINYLRLPPTAPPIEEYLTWQKVLEDSFGKKRFVEMSIDQKTIYGR